MGMARANSHYNGLQLTAVKRLAHGLQGQINYKFRRETLVHVVNEEVGPKVRRLVRQRCAGHR